MVKRSPRRRQPVRLLSLRGFGFGSGGRATNRIVRRPSLVKEKAKPPTSLRRGSQTAMAQSLTELTSDVLS